MIARPARRPRALGRRTAAVVAGLAVALGLAACGGGSDDALPTFPTRPAATTGPAQQVTQADRPNIILITTDDETASDMAWMPKTERYLARQGVSFTRALSPHPLCCPARAAILTGQYAQNNHVKTNQHPFDFVALDNTATLPVWMQQAGYNTAFMGKYLNGYGTHGVPQPGWGYWDPTMVGQYAYVGYRMYQNGNQEWFAHLNNVDYINRELRRTVARFSADRKPFFIWASHVAPHGRIDTIRGIPSTAVPLPPKRFAHEFPDVQSPSLSDPGYYADDVATKNSLVRSKKVPTKDHVNRVFRQRIRALQGVDEGVQKLVEQLKRLHQLDNTYVVFTSDNGFLLGQHHLITKNVPYRQAIRVPMFVRGPGIPKGVQRSQRALMIDLAPTIAALGHATPMLPPDGMSLLPAMVQNAPTRNTVLIQAGPTNKAQQPYGWFWRGVTTDRYTYARFFSDGIEELYDHDVDPDETHNVAADPAYAPVLAELRRRTQALVTCTTPGQCSTSFGPDPQPLTSP